MRSGRIQGMTRGEDPRKVGGWGGKEQGVGMDEG